MHIHAGSTTPVAFDLDRLVGSIVRNLRFATGEVSPRQHLVGAWVFDALAVEVGKVVDEHLGNVVVRVHTPNRVER